MRKKALATIILTVAIVAGYIFLEQPKAELPEPTFENAKHAIVAKENKTFERIISTNPELLTLTDKNGNTLWGYSLWHFNEEGLEASNLDVANFIIGSDFPDHSASEKVNFDEVVRAIGAVNDQLGRIDLTDDMRLLEDRERYLEILNLSLLSIPEGENIGDGSKIIELVLDVCDRASYGENEIFVLSSDARERIAANTTALHRNFINSYVKTRILNESCVNALYESI